MKNNKKAIALFVLSSTLLISSVGYADWLIVADYDYNKEFNKVETTPVAYIIGKTAKYTTIEKALEAAVSGDIVCLVPPTKNNYHSTNNKVTPDKVEYTISRSCTIKEGVTLVLPTDAASISSVTNSTTLNSYIQSMYTDDRSQGSSTAHANTASNNYLRTTLRIKDGVELTNNGTLVVSGYLSGGNSNVCTMGQTAYSYSQILLGKNAKIIQDNANAKTHCYGFISESTKNNGSLFQVKKGELNIPFVVHDYRGFSFSWSMTGTEAQNGAINKYRCSAFNQFELRNIDSKVEVSYGVNVYGISNVYVNYSSSYEILNVNKVFTNKLNIVGTSTDFVFQMNSSQSKIEFKFDKNLSDLELEKFNINVIGGLKVNNFKLYMKESVVEVDLSTTNAFFPFSYKYDISLTAASGQTTATFDTTLQRIKFLPGSKLTINDKCLLKANELIVYSTFYDGTYGNNKTASSPASGKAYPLKEGAILKVEDGGQITSTSLAGTIYGDSNNITCTTNNITSNEPWVYGSNPDFSALGKDKRVWEITEYIEIREKLNIVPLSYLESKKKLYVGMNTFKNYNSFLPSFNLILDEGTSTYTLNQYQEVIHVDSVSNYYFEFLANVYKAFYSKNYYNEDYVVSLNNTNAILGVVNSTVSILSNNSEGKNEFHVQDIEITCKTPLVDNKIPLYVDSTVSLEANIKDLEKIYNKTCTWSVKAPEDPNEEPKVTVDQNGNVTGLALGEAVICVTCDGMTKEFPIEVISEESVEIVNIESIFITDNKGNSSNTVITTNNNVNYHGKYSNGTDVTFSLNVNPTNANYSSIVWKFKASAAGRQYVFDNTVASETIEDATSVVVHIVSDSGADDDYATLTCTVIGLDGVTHTATFGIVHESDFSICFTKGTLLTMADGTQKVIEDVTFDDIIMTFNHHTGKYEAKPILFIAKHEYDYYQVMVLKFSDGTVLELSGIHSLFNLTRREYSNFTIETAQGFIGDEFLMYNPNSADYLKDGVRLESVEIVTKYTELYTIASKNNVSAIINGILSNTPYAPNTFNIFTLDDSLKYDSKLMEEDIKKYGLYKYEEFDKYVSKEFFDAFDVKYYKVAVGKGYMTDQDMLELAGMVKSWIDNGIIVFPN